MSVGYNNFRSQEWEKLRTLLPSDLLESIATIWEDERTKSMPDFDCLITAARMSKRIAPFQVQSRLKEWLQHYDEYEQNVWDVAGCFLMGYWPGEENVYEELVEILLRVLEDSPLGIGPRDAIIAAISYCHGVLRNDDILRRIDTCFRKLWEQRKDNAYQPHVVNALAKVLKMKE